MVDCVISVGFSEGQRHGGVVPVFRDTDQSVTYLYQYLSILNSDGQKTDFYQLLNIMHRKYGKLAFGHPGMM